MGPNYKKKFETELRDVARDQRCLPAEDSQWTMRTEHAEWIFLHRETKPLHYLHVRSREASIKATVNGLETVLGEPPAVLSTHYGNNVAVVFQNADVLCLLSREGMSLYASDFEVLDRIVQANVVPKVSQARSVNLLSSGKHGIQISFAGHIDRPLNEKAYPAHVRQQIREVAAWAENPNPFGRIAIFAGPPGTGKSFAVRALITETEHVEWVIVPPHLVSRLAGPDMVQVLIDQRSEEGPLGLIVEDADTLLRERAAGNDENVISQVLNLGEGIPGDIADLRIVMTTNVARLQIDKALLRKGRLFKFVQFDKLEPEHAAALYKDLTGKEHTFRDPVALSDVYGLANEHDTNVQEPSLDGMGQYV